MRLTYIFSAQISVHSNCVVGMECHFKRFSLHFPFSAEMMEFQLFRKWMCSYVVIESISSFLPAHTEHIGLHPKKLIGFNRNGCPEKAKCASLMAPNWWVQRTIKFEKSTLETDCLKGFTIISKLENWLATSLPYDGSGYYVPWTPWSACYYQFS